MIDLRLKVRELEPKEVDGAARVCDLAKEERRCWRNGWVGEEEDTMIWSTGAWRKSSEELNYSCGHDMSLRRRV